MAGGKYDIEASCAKSTGCLEREFFSLAEYLPSLA